MKQIPNILSFLRLLAAPLLVWALLTEEWHFAFWIFWFAVFSDLFDGPIARRYNLESGFGHKLDHIADVVFTSMGLATLVWLDTIPMTLVILQLLAFLEYSLYGPQRSAFVTSYLGRLNGVLYFVLLGIPITQWSHQWNVISSDVIVILAWSLAAATFVSLTLRIFSRLKSQSS